MTWTPLSLVGEEGVGAGEARWVRHPLRDVGEECGVGEVPVVDQELALVAHDLDPRSIIMLGKVFEGKRGSAIAREMHLSQSLVSQVLTSAKFKLAEARMETAMLERIARGEFGALAIAKANTVGAMRRLVGMSRGAMDERVKLNATIELLKLGGIQPSKPAVTESPERLVDLMTDDEARVFAETGHFPDRLMDQVARLASGVVRERQRQTMEAEVLAVEEIHGEREHVVEGRGPAREETAEEMEERMGEREEIDEEVRG